MRNKRLQFGDRREIDNIFRVPFKDSNGKLILGCRRMIPDRRLNNIQSEWIGESVFR